MNDDAPDCADCGYPLYATPCSTCTENREKQEREQARINACWGGARAVKDFRREALAETPSNQVALKVIDSWDPKTQNIYLYGPTGVGKTHMAIAAARKHWKPRDGYRPFRKAMEIGRAIRASQDARDEAEIIKALIDQPILIIDDLGTENASDFIPRIIYEIVDGRDMEGHGGLIITSNLNLPELGEFLKSDRVTSRLTRISRIVNLTEEKDHRRKVRDG